MTILYNYVKVLLLKAALPVFATSLFVCCGDISVYRG